MHPDDRPLLSRRAAELSLALIAVLAGAIVMWGALENNIGWDASGPEAGYFPFYVGCVIVLAGLGVLAEAWFKADPDECFLTRRQLSRIASFFLPIVGYVIVSIVLGLYVGSALYLFAAMWLQGKYGILRSAALSIAVSLAFFILFEWCFQMPLLKGPLEAALGIY
jgi:hypothetical protein